MHTILREDRTKEERVKILRDKYWVEERKVTGEKDNKELGWVAESKNM